MRIANISFCHNYSTPRSNLVMTYPDQKLDEDCFQKSKQATQRGQLCNEEGSLFSRGTTYFFRDDVNWYVFQNYLQKRFRDCDKVNTYVYACSDGSEAYTMSMLLQNIDKTGKFLPIKAKDINEDAIKDNIERQKEGVLIDDESCEKATILWPNYMGQADEYIEQQRYCNVLKDKTTAPVEFSCANILEDIDSIDSENPSIVMCRNMWPYVSHLEQPKYAKELYNKLAKGSIVVVGKYDLVGEWGAMNTDKIRYALCHAGFEKMECPIFNLNANYDIIFEKN